MPPHHRQSTNSLIVICSRIFFHVYFDYVTFFILSSRLTAPLKTNVPRMSKQPGPDTRVLEMEKHITFW